MKTMRTTLRLSEEAYKIIMRLPPKVRTKTVSEIIIRADARGWINEIKARETKAILQSVGLSVEDVLALHVGENLPPFPPEDDEGDLPPESEEPILGSLQERLDKLIDF
ncbi:hypothetical protein SAMN02745206_03589 [Desulfacinum infernum DSM 9756]|uniref:Uncharacterized protein n=1 Tax=Desulfacinum infernum DSM 9756 TaxID=1121391 RepID=A0A1M5IGA0_9BACT|nr:hypothetical protein [Desulfacinum infernum]SHG27245.1 hypothetical protein SAMN02745206_03589 [Desulfacinum infernum DSM 9756]